MYYLLKLMAHDRMKHTTIILQILGVLKVLNHLLNSNFRCKKWVKKNLGRDDLHSKNTDQLRRNNLLCANHFELSQFMNPTLKNKLIHCAVPTLFDVPNKPKENNTKQAASKEKVYTSSINISICKNSSNRLW